MPEADDTRLVLAILARGVPRELLRDAAAEVGPEVAIRLRPILDSAPGAVSTRVVSGEPVVGESAPESLPAAGDKYRILGEIGRGGLGSVQRAFDRAIGREVALKTTQPGLPAGPVERFLREGRIAGRLEHPNIVPVHEIGTMFGPDGGEQAYFTMKRVGGRDLRQILADARGSGLSLRALIGVFHGVCMGMAFAHSRGVLHRDLKPANIMVGEFGETLIVDWGLARDRNLTADSSGQDLGGTSPELTMDGDVMGTPAYMSPEQASGETGRIDERSDVYALGGILYEILTCRPPVEGNSIDEVISHVRSGAVIAPSRVASTPGSVSRPAPPWAVPPELEVICLRCLSLRMEDRYPSALDVARDVQRWLDGDLERERRAAEAARNVAEGDGHASRFRELTGDIAAQTAAVKTLREQIRPSAPAEKKGPIWDAEARLSSLVEERIRAYTDGIAAYERALAADPACSGGAEGRFGLMFGRLKEAEGRRDHPEVLLLRGLILAGDIAGRHRSRLDAAGTLQIRTFARDCSCLAPIRAEGWEAAIASEATIPWREGRPARGATIADPDRLVPDFTMSPGKSWGHGASCPRREVPGVEVWVSRYEERNRRLVAGDERCAGRTPLGPVELPQGSWRCRLHVDGFVDALVPFVIERGGTWTQDVDMLRPTEIPQGFVQVPAGPFSFGGEWAGGGRELQTLVAREVLVSRVAITIGEYLEFLNSLAAAGDLDTARRRQPRQGPAQFLVESAGRFELPPADNPRGLLFQSDFPVVGVSWHDTVAFLAWRSRRDGLPYTLLHEEEWEKAARGVDSRTYPFGEHFDEAFAHTAFSFEGPPRLAPVGSFPFDESPYGILDFAGSAATWCLGSIEMPRRAWMSLRGGNFDASGHVSRVGGRQGLPADSTSKAAGIRLALRPDAWPPPSA